MERSEYDIQPVEADDTGLSVWVVAVVVVVAIALLSVPAWFLIRELTKVEIGAPDRPDPTGPATLGTLRIRVDTTLTTDHIGDIIIAADNVTLDCAGHTITGPGRFEDLHGISLLRRTGVTVRNCSITNHNAGFLINQSNGNLFANNTISGVRTGFTLFASDNNTIARNHVSNAVDWFGYGLLDGSDSNSLTDNIATSGVGIGFVTIGTDNHFSANEATDNSGTGMAVDGRGSTGNVYAGNKITGNTSWGIEDTTTGGSGDAGTDNSYDNNVCDANLRGDSFPDGLC